MQPLSIAESQSNLSLTAMSLIQGTKQCLTVSGPFVTLFDQHGLLGHWPLNRRWIRVVPAHAQDLAELEHAWIALAAGFLNVVTKV